MTKTRQQKEQEVQKIESMLESSKGFLTVGFTGIPVEDLNEFRGELLDANGEMRVVKKTLFGLVLENENIDFEVDQFQGQTALIAFSGDLAEIAGKVFDFAEGREMEVFGGYDLVEDSPVDSEFMEKVGRLPSREVLLGQVAAAVGAPLRAVMQGLKAKASNMES